MPPLTTYVITSFATTQPTPTPTTMPTWNPGAVQTVVFVDPSTYGLATNDSELRATRFNASSLDMNMTTFATLGSSEGASGTTKTMYIPFPYWELEYTVDPATKLTQSKFEITPTGGSGIAHSGIEGSYSTVKPEFSIQVMDGDDPNRIVRTITPPGGIDLDLWLGNEPEDNEYPTRTSKYAEQVTPDITPVDPRPWTEKFYEGQRNYYFIFTAKGLNSYSMEIKVPNRYIGQY